MKKIQILAGLGLALTLAVTPVSTAMAAQRVNDIIKSSVKGEVLWSNIKNQSDKENYINVWAAEIPMKEVKGFTIANTVGNISIQPHDKEDTSVEAEMQLKIRDSSQIKSSVLDKAEVKYSVENNVLKLDVVEKSSGTDMVQWLEKNYKSSAYEFSVSYTIFININSELNYTLTTEVGNINLDGLKGTVNIDAAVGNMSVTSPELKGTNSVSTEVGNIFVEADNINNADKISLTNEVGNLHFTFNKSAGYTLTKKTAFTKASTVKSGSGKTIIDLNGSVGNVSYSTK